MVIHYKSRAVEQQFASKHQKKWHYPEQVKEKLKATETFIEQAASLSDIINYPPFHFHHMKGKRKEEWSIYLGKTGYRVTMVPCDDHGQKITSAEILLLSVNPLR